MNDKAKERERARIRKALGRELSAQEERDEFEAELAFEATASL